MPQDSLSVANHLLRASKEFKDPLDNLKLQKLLYFAHGWWYALKGKPLLNEAIQAWNWGPVVYSVYNEFKRFGSSRIQGRAVDRFGNVARLSQDDEGMEIRRFLEAVAWIYRDHKGTDMVDETHALGSPWRQVYDSNKGKLSYFEQIPEESIKTHFLSRANSSDMHKIRSIMAAFDQDE